MDDFVTFRGEFDKKKSASDKRYKDNSKKRLLSNLKKKFEKIKWIFVFLWMKRNNLVYKRVIFYYGFSMRVN